MQEVHEADEVHEVHELRECKRFQEVCEAHETGHRMCVRELLCTMYTGYTMDTMDRGGHGVQEMRYTSLTRYTRNIPIRYTTYIRQTHFT